MRYGIGLTMDGPLLVRAYLAANGFRLEREGNTTRGVPRHADSAAEAEQNATPWMTDLQLVEALAGQAGVWIAEMVLSLAKAGEISNAHLDAQADIAVWGEPDLEYEFSQN